MFGRGCVAVLLFLVIISVLYRVDRSPAKLVTFVVVFVVFVVLSVDETLWPDPGVVTVDCCRLLIVTRLLFKINIKT